MWLCWIFVVVLLKGVNLRPPLISYTGQPLDLSPWGLRSVEANKAAKYAAQFILDERLTHWNLPPCVLVTPQILSGTSKVVAGIEYNMRLSLSYQSLRNRTCREENTIEYFQEEECRVRVVYQPFKPPIATFAVIHSECGDSSLKFPDARQ